MSNIKHLRNVYYDIRAITNSINPMVIRRRMHRNLLRAQKIYNSLLSNDDLGTLVDIAEMRGVDTQGSYMEILLRLASISPDPKTTAELARIVEDGLIFGEKKFIAHASRELDGNIDLTTPVPSKIIWTGP